MPRNIRYTLLCCLVMMLFFTPVRTDAKTVSVNKGEAIRLTSASSNVTWKSKNTSIVTVNEKGLVKAKKVGKTTITETKGKKTYSHTVVVTKRPKAANPFWNDIKETKAGEVIEAEKIDFSSQLQYFKSYTISDKVYKEIKGKSFTPGGKIKRSDLKYIKVLHYNWDGEIQVGEMIVNKKIAETVCTTFRKLFDEEYPIYSMYLIEKFWKGNGAKSDDYSCKMNNTSAFCYRTITGKSKRLSNHAYGYAIDINPKQNPYVKKRNGKWVADQSNAASYVNRSNRKKGMINHSDYAYTLFHKTNFKWGGDWNSPKDYQHFEFMK